MGNSQNSDNITQGQALRNLKERLPRGWRLQCESHRPRTDARPVAADLTAPDGKKARLLIEIKRHLEPRDVQAVAERMRSFMGATRKALPIVVSPFLTPRAQHLLKEADLSFLDLTGNCWIVSSSPGLFISTSGLEKNPHAEDRAARSLKGPVAGRVVRALCDFLPPLGVRKLASTVEADPGYVSRLLAMLDGEALIVRKPRGAIESVDWKALLRRWAVDYSPFSSSRAYSFLEPRGLNAFVHKLRTFPHRYALTGSMAAASVAPVAPARLAVCYVDDPDEAARELDLRPAEAGMNVMLVAPFDAVVYERTWNKDELNFAALSQVAADLLTSPGRGTEEASALFEWMARDERAWRT